MSDVLCHGKIAICLVVLFVHIILSRLKIVPPVIVVCINQLWDPTFTM